LADDERGSSVYAAYIESQVRDQEALKGSIEQRGVAVITTCGTLVSLLFGLAAVLTGVEKYELPSAAEPWLYAALIAFVLAAITAIVTNLPLFYIGVRVEELRGAVKNRWSESPEDAKQRVAATQVKVLARAKKLNKVKGIFLMAAIVAEVFAVVFLALAIRAILLG
jgi:uncharacterized membrane protein